MDLVDDLVGLEEQSDYNDSLSMSFGSIQSDSVGFALNSKCERPPKYFKCVGENRSIEEIRILTEIILKFYHNFSMSFFWSFP